jgi:hypothetical protein
MHRSYEDGVVRGMPSSDEIEAVKKIYPEARFRLLAGNGDRLRDSQHRDSYSYELADIFLGGRDQADLLRKFERVLDMVTFDVEPVHRDAV